MKVNWKETHGNSSFACTTIVADDIKSNSIRTKKLFHKAYSTLRPLNHFASSQGKAMYSGVVMKEIFRCKCWPATRQSTDYSLSALTQSKHKCSYLPCLGTSSSGGKFCKKGHAGIARTQKLNVFPY